MDMDDELKSFKRILIAGLLFLMSAYFSYQEIKFMVWGETAEASVTNVFETSERGRRGRSRKMLAVEYSFTDDEGQMHSERDDVRPSFGAPAGNVMVQYLPGVSDSSRLEGHSNSMSLWIFGGSLAWLGYMIFKMSKEANEPFAVRR